jgi:hypothetical protein
VSAPGAIAALLAASLPAAALVAAEAAEGQSPPVRVEPSVSVVPANHLKFYLHFPGPMERGEVFRHLRLAEVDGEGAEIAEVPEPFREVELWDETFTRLTLWFHPGRQKPGVNLNVEIGPVLEEGRRYALEISGKWRRESGEPLGGGVRHRFAAGPFDGVQPDPRRWKAEVKEGSLLLLVDEPLDPASLRKSLSVVDAAGATVGEIAPARLELCGSGSGEWAAGYRIELGPLSAGSYRLRIDARLEDLAGNSVARPFNVDLERNSGSASEEPVDLPFTLPPGL